MLGNHQFSLLCPLWYVQNGFFWQQWNTELWKAESTFIKIWWWDFRLWWLCLPLPLCLTLLDTAQHSQFFAKLLLNKLSLHKQPHFHSTYGFENSLYPLGSCDAEQKLWPELWHMAESSVNPKFLCVFIWLQNVIFLTYDGDLHLQMLNMSQWQTGAMLTVFCEHWQQPQPIKLWESLYSKCILYSFLMYLYKISSSIFLKHSIFKGFKKLQFMGFQGCIFFCSFSFSFIYL